MKSKILTDLALGEVIDEWVVEEIVREAEIEAAEVQWALEQKERTKEWESQKPAVSDRLKEFRSRLDEHRSAGQEKLEAFADQAGAGFEQIRDACKSLTL